MEITKAHKGSDQYLIDWCDYVIGDLVKEKTDLVKAPLQVLSNVCFTALLMGKNT